MPEQKQIYIGHRYVPLIMGVWDKLNSYEGLSIVTYLGNSYTSKKRVPTGIEIDNEEFWVVTGNYNAQIENYREAVNGYRDEVETYKDTVIETNFRVSDVFYINDYPRIIPEISDSGRLQRIADAMVKGGTLSLNSGETYEITSPLLLKKGNIILSGRNAKFDLKNSMDYAIEFEGSNNRIFDLSFKKEKTNLTIGAIRMKGLQNTISNIVSRDCVWEKFIHGVGMKESHLSNIRVDNDTLVKSESKGTIIWLDYCVNMTITNSMIGFAKTGIYLSDVADPLNGNYCEGVLTNSNIYVFCDTAVKADNSTFLTVTGSVLDFCGVTGVTTTNGNTSLISGNWIKVMKAGNAIVGHTNFSRAKIIGNTILGEADVTGQTAFSVASINSIVKDNNIVSLNGGVVTATTSIEKDNIVTGGTGIESSRKETNGYYSGVSSAVMFNKSNTFIELEAWEYGSTNYLYAKGHKGVASTDMHVLNVIASSGLTLGAKNALGTQAIAGFGNVTNLRIRTKETTL